MIYDFDHLPDRIKTDSIKWTQYPADVLPLWVADMDFPVAEPILHSLRSRIDHGIFGYPATHPRPGQVSELKELLMERMLRLYHWQVEPEQLLLLPGVIVGLNLSCHAEAVPGGNVVVQTPVYPPFLRVPQNAGMTRHDAQLYRAHDGHYEVDWDSFESQVDDQTRLFILCNPHNPVGRVWRRDELERMAGVCLRKGVVICSDEIHCDLVYHGHQHLPIASLDKEIARNTVTLMAPTKTFNIAGLQCSFAIVQDEKLRQRLEASMRGLVMWVNLLGMNATLAAYQHGQEWLEQVLAYLGANCDFLYDYVNAELPELRMVKPEGTYLAWLDCREAGIGDCPYDFFLKEGRVAFNDGATFGNGGEGFVRLNYACSRQVLTQALERMRAALRNKKN